MSQVINFIKLDFNRSNNVTIPTIEWDQGSRFVRVQLQNNNQSVDVTGSQVVITVIRNDLEEVIESCNILNAKEGLIEFEISKSMVARQGDMLCQLKLSDNDSLLSSQLFKISVNNTLMVSLEESRSEMDALIHALGEVQNIDNRFAQTNAQLSELGNYVTPQMFGAKGDGKTNDYLALKQTHEYANNNNLNVIYQTGIYVIDDVEEPIEIKTNVDFMNSTISVKEYVGKSTYKVSPSKSGYKVFTDDIKVQFSNEWNNGNEYITELSQYKNHFFYIRSNDLLVKRSSGGTYYVEQSIITDKNGEVVGDRPKKFIDLKDYTRRYLEDAYITISNGFFLIRTEEKIEQGVLNAVIYSERCKVNFNNLTARLSNNTDSSNRVSQGFIRLYHSYDVKLSNISTPSRNHKNNTLEGTYGLSLWGCMKIELSNINSNGSMVDNWGSVTGNYVKDIVYERCSLNRLDIHAWGHNITVRDCNLTGSSIMVMGSGLLSVERCKLTLDKDYGHDHLVAIRTDYGSIWDGTINIKDCMINTWSNKSACILNFENKVFDFGVARQWGETITIDNVTFNLLDKDNNSDSVYFGVRFKGITSNQTPDVYAPQRINLTNLNVLGRNKGICAIYMKNAHKFKSSKVGSIESDGRIYPNSLIIVENCNLNVENVTKVQHEIDDGSLIIYSDGSHTLPINSCYIPQITVKNPIGKVGFGMRHLISKISVENAYLNNIDIAGYNGQTVYSQITFDNCTFKPILNTTQNGFYLGTSQIHTFNNCIFDIPIINGSPILTYTDFTNKCTPFATLNGYTANIINCRYVDEVYNLTGSNFIKVVANAISQLNTVPTHIKLSELRKPIMYSIIENNATPDAVVFYGKQVINTRHNSIRIYKSDGVFTVKEFEPQTAYKVDSVFTANGKVYICTVAGASSDIAPSHDIGEVKNGTASFKFLNTLPTYLEFSV